MTEFVADCPRCTARRVTFDLPVDTPLPSESLGPCEWEAFCVCRACKRASVFLFVEGDASVAARKSARLGGRKTLLPARPTVATSDERYHLRPVTPADLAAAPPPEQLPALVDQAFREAAKCAAVNCHNAAGAMFRLCLDLAAKDHNATGNTLFERLQSLCDEKQFAPGLQDLATAVCQDGNNGAHDGTLDRESVEDMAAFADRFLTQLYTEPARLAAAQKRREKRKGILQQREADRPRRPETAPPPGPRLEDEDGQTERPHRSVVSAPH